MHFWILRELIFQLYFVLEIQLNSEMEKNRICDSSDSELHILSASLVLSNQSAKEHLQTCKALFRSK